MPVKKLDHHVAPGEAGRTDALVARLTGLSRSCVRGLIDHGGVTVNGRACTDSGLRIDADDRVAIKFEPGRRYREKAPERATRGFTLVYADEHLVVVDKVAGVLTVPTSHGERHTLIDLISMHLGKGQARRRGVSVVHRLDRDTSGLLVFGRTPEIARKLSAQFAARKPEREYAAIVAGSVEKDEGEIRSHLATDKALNQKSVRIGATRGELAITHFVVRERYGRDATLLAVNLETGRRNQIRVHCAEMGHPILGDVRYRADDAKHRAWPCPRLALHARILGFTHPVDGRPLRFESDLPREFVEFKKRWNGRG